jgi:uncharacterized protein (TIGR02246 family)
MKIFVKEIIKLELLQFKFMKNIFRLILLNFMVLTISNAQENTPSKKQALDIHSLIENYAQAREKKDVALLESILTADVDQLVSSGKWRRGKKESMEGMLQSSMSNPGTRTLKIEKIRLFNPQCALVDARYEIKNTHGTTRKMWSSFVVVLSENKWKISAIRNMLPAGQK